MMPHSLTAKTADSKSVSVVDTANLGSNPSGAASFKTHSAKIFQELAFKATTIETGLVFMRYFMNVLIACEESQEVCKAFRAKGHRAFSCDI